MSIQKLFSLFVGLLLFGCNTTNPDAAHVVAHASISEFGDGGYACEDTRAVARSVGVDYDEVVAGCLHRDNRSMHTLFWLSAHASFDAASSQGHAAVTGHLLRHLGDGYYGTLLAKEDAVVREAVWDDLFYDFGGEDWTTMDILREQYPLTFGASAAR